MQSATAVLCSDSIFDSINQVLRVPSAQEWATITLGHIPSSLVLDAVIMCFLVDSSTELT